MKEENDYEEFTVDNLDCILDDVEGLPYVLGQRPENDYAPAEMKDKKVGGQTRASILEPVDAKTIEKYI